MTEKEFVEVIDELLVVDAQDEQVTSTEVNGSSIHVKCNDGSVFVVTVRQIL